jgi:hypothetical protein
MALINFTFENCRIIKQEQEHSASQLTVKLSQMVTQAQHFLTTSKIANFFSMAKKHAQKQIESTYKE